MLELIAQAGNAGLKALIVFNSDLKALYGEKICHALHASLDLFVFIGSNWNGSCDIADIILPSSVYAEKEGTFTNIEGRVQRLNSAFRPLGEAKVEWEILKCIAGNLNEAFPYGSAGDLLIALGENVSSFKGFNMSIVGDQGLPLNEGARNQRAAYSGV